MLLVVMILGLGSPAAWAKTLKVAKGSMQVNQLHEELLVRFPAWRGTLQPDGSFTDPLLQVESTDQEIRLTVPDTANEASVQAVIAAHKPKPKIDKAAEERAKDPTSMTLEDRVKRLEILLGAE